MKQPLFFYSSFILRSADKCYRKGAEHCDRNADCAGLKRTCNNSQKAVLLYRFLYTFCKGSTKTRQRNRFLICSIRAHVILYPIS